MITLTYKTTYEVEEDLTAIVEITVDGLTVNSKISMYGESLGGTWGYWNSQQGGKSRIRRLTFRADKWSDLQTQVDNLYKECHESLTEYAHHIKAVEESQPPNSVIITKF